MNKRLLTLLGVIIITAAIPITMYVGSQSADPRTRAQTADDPEAPNNFPEENEDPELLAQAQPTQPASCATPDAITNVQMDYPVCEGDTCSYDRASCSWTMVTDASSYNITITQVESGTVIKNETVTAPTTTYSFPVTQNKTYRCDVSATNACGNTGTAGSESLLCATDFLPTTAPQPTTPPVVQPTRVPPTAAPTLPPRIVTPRPTMAPPGGVETTMLFGAAGIGFVIIGGLLFLL